MKPMKTLMSLLAPVSAVGIEVVPFENELHREQVVVLWERVFGYPDQRNDPSLVIDKKLAMGDGLFLVAVDGDQVVGTVMAGYDGHRGWIYSMAVLQERRGAGIGSRLLEQAEGELVKLGCVKINLQIFGTNEAVKGFYEKCGYRVEDRTSMGKELTENVR
jgi:ribosomal protein S18 acetylase RimI-like enzyme